MSVAQDNHLRSPEEDDLIYRSTKKIKDGNSEVMDVEKETIVDEVTSPAEKPAEIVRMVTEELFPDLKDTKKAENLEVKNQDSVVPITKAQEVENTVQDSNGGRQEINVNSSITDVQEKDSSQQRHEEQAIFGPWMLVRKSPRKITKVNNMKQEGGIEKPQGDRAHISGTRFEILSSDADQDWEVNMDNSQHGKKQTPKAQTGNQAGPSHTKIVVPKLVKHYNQNQKLLPGNSKKNHIPLKNQNKPVVSKDSQTKEESSSKNLSPKTVAEQEKKDWENEILAMMSRYHSKIWESQSKGEYVGDPLSLDKNNNFQIMKGLDVDSSLGKSVILNLDRPLDTTEYRGSIDQSTSMEVQISSDHPTVGTVAQPKQSTIINLALPTSDHCGLWLTLASCQPTPPLIKSFKFLSSWLSHSDFKCRMDDNLFPPLTPKVKENLIRMPSHEEIKKSLFSIGNFKAPGPDGMHDLFYKSQWDIVAPTIVDLITQVWTNPGNIKDINQTLITLLPKIDSPTRPAHFRPISLCNVSYKVVKVLIM
ncbi:ribonuclease H [Sesbania bispinosa]|nr:ribonuclease H [Sesbania bispinosa]